MSTRARVPAVQPRAGDGPAGSAPVRCLGTRRVVVITPQATGRIRPSVRAAVVSTALYGVTSFFFAISTSYPLAVVLLVAGGVANLASMSIGQTIVQLLAPAPDRGRVIGVYGMSANGLRFGSGFTVGLLGAAMGVHWSLAVSAAALFAGTLAAGAFALRGRRPVPLPAD